MARAQDEVCPDFHTCRNGARCVESTIKEGAFVCDCDAINVKVSNNSTSFAGVSCEHESTVNCNEDNKKSYTSFCTNGGTCKKMVGVNGVHEGCHCIKPYRGEFCEYMFGQKLPDHMDPDGKFDGIGMANVGGSSGGGSSSDNSTAIVASLSVLVVLGIVIVAAAYYYVKRQRTDEKPNSQPITNNNMLRWEAATTNDLQLDADGGVLQEAMQEKTSTGGIHPNTTGNQQPDNVDDVKVKSKDESEATFVIDIDGGEEEDVSKLDEVEKGGGLS